MDVAERARTYAALGDPHRLAIVDGLWLGDRTFDEVATIADLPGNLAAHHLNVLEASGLVERRVSEGDRRRRYITLRRDRLPELATPYGPPPDDVLFVCTHNSARSQFAAALWKQVTGRNAESAGTSPASRVHPDAVRAAAAFGLDLSEARPRSYDSVSRLPDLVISVCDRARESGIPFTAPSIHWSVPDPVRASNPAAFQAAFTEIADRIERFALPSDQGPVPVAVTVSRRRRTT
jgi:ArsR family transcriptional regulator, arsenate/arsenite/antimonite-responsive transcriptional repressor / arsenate reductase (thioredoxin)